MYYSRDFVSVAELGLSLGVLSGIATLQATGQVFGLVICALIGLVLGQFFAHITRQLKWRLT